MGLTGALCRAGAESSLVICRLDRDAVGADPGHDAGRGLAVRAPLSEAGASPRPSLVVADFTSVGRCMPQVVEVPAGSILADALAAAGGPAPEAISKASISPHRWADHQQVLIPTPCRRQPLRAAFPVTATPAPTLGPCP